MNKERIKDLINAIPTLKKYFINQREKKGSIIKIENLSLDNANIVLLTTPIDKNICVGLVKDLLVDFEGYIYCRSYYPKYERFLRNNHIKYEYFDIHSNDWIDQAAKYKIVIWATYSSPAEQTEAMQKIYILEQMGIKCMPSFNDVFKYEDKVEMHYFYKTNNLPEIPTFVSHSKSDSITFAKNTKYPIISKISTGSASYGVNMIKSQKDALRFIKNIFSYKGGKTYWNYTRQKDYVYFQQFIEDSKYDLRVIVVGDSLFGYYRYPNKEDYRASGAGNYEKKAIPTKALDIAWETKNKYGSHLLATDFVYSSKEDKFYIIESSIIIGIDTPQQLVVNEVSGRYIRSIDGTYSFETGEYWIQELALKSFFESI